MSSPRVLSYVDALNEAFHQAMAADASVIILGENIRRGVRAETRGLDEAFGDERVLDMPISEAAFTGYATGAALEGLRPVVEFQVASLMFPAFDQIVNQAAKLPLMLGGQRHIPVTYLVMGAGAGGGRAGQHSDNPYAFLIHAGIKTVYPSNAHDVKGLMLSAIRENDPVALIAPATLLGQTSEVPEAPYEIPFGSGAVRRNGTDITVVAVGHLVNDALAVAETLTGEGISVAVWDPRSLFPLDKEGLVDAVAQTGRVVFFDDSTRTCGFAAELMSVVTERGFDRLKSAPQRVTRAEATIAYSPDIEQATLPTRHRLEVTIRRMLEAAR